MRSWPRSRLRGGGAAILVVAACLLMLAPALAFAAEIAGPSDLRAVMPSEPPSSETRIPAGSSLRPDRGVSGEVDWTALYIGGHVGISLGFATSTLPLAIPPSLQSFFASLGGGLQVGYAHMLASRLVLGVEADVSFPNFFDDGLAFSVPSPQGTVSGTIDCSGTLRARLGYGWGRWQPFVTGGLAWASQHFTIAASADQGSAWVSRTSPGWTVGAGVDLALSDSWVARLEALHEEIAPTSVSLSPVLVASSSFSVNTLRIGLNWAIPGTAGKYRAGDDDSSAPSSSDAPPGEPAGPARWSIHGQATVVGQGYPSFRSPYQGENSLSGNAQFAATVSATGFLGVRLWEGAEVYFNPELMQGFGLSGVHGVAGFPNGEAQKSNFPVPRFNVARLYLTQTIGLGGEQEAVEDGVDRIRGTRDVSRLSFTAGKFSTTDFFLLNAFAGGPRTEFLNWNLYGSGSYDQTMDKLSWTWGGFMELNQPSWAVRAGYFLLPVESNSNSFDTQVPGQGQYMLEGEVRYGPTSLPGKVTVTAWLSRGNMGGYADALAQATSSPGYPDISDTRRIRTNYGFVVGLEQALTTDLGLFARVSWSPGQVEIMGWTDCSSSIAVGASLKGTSWGRPTDVVGLGGVVEGLSSVARAYFAAGGMGILIGDGQLSYRPEAIVETYYAYSPLPWLTATADYQFVLDPGYNSARGPVSIFTGRIHIGF